MNSAEEYSPAPPAVASTPRPNLIAPAWHTVVLILVLLVFSLASAGSQAQFVDEQGRMTMYLMTMGWEWALTLYVIWGLRRKNVPLADVIGDRWKSPLDALFDIGIAGGFWLLSALVLAGMAYALGLAQEQNIKAAREQISFLFPGSASEVMVWGLLSATAGFCEEIIFRGYLQTQLSRMSGAVWIGIAAQAVVFGGSHAYEGWQRMIIIAVWGTMFGILALMRRSLRPGMMAHTFHNFFVGVAGRVLLG